MTTRVIKAKSASRKHKTIGHISSLEINLKATFDDLTRDEIQQRVAGLENDIHELMRNYFNVKNIKIK